jgi:tetratricopeptide (TPR) repeat protein
VSEGQTSEIIKARFLEKTNMPQATRKVASLLLVVAIVAGCTGQRTEDRRQQPADQAPSVSEGMGKIGAHPAAAPASLRKALAEFNRGAGLLEQYKYAEAAKAFETVLEIAPDWDAARFNLGLAYFNLQETPGGKDYLKNAQEAFEAVPNHLHARFCLGLYWQHLGQNDKALECFQAVHQADGSDPHVAYKYAEALLSVGRNEEGTQMLEEVVALDPGFISAIYRLAGQYQRSKQREKAMPLFARFKNLSDAELTGGSFTVLKAYGTVGKYYMALDADNLPRPILETPPPVRILFSPEVKSINGKILDWKYPGGTVSLPGLAAGDVDGDGDIDLLITAIGENGSTSLWLNNGRGEFSHHATIAQQGISPCFGDVDNDGDIDLWLGCAGPDLYFENDGKGNLKRILNSEFSILDSQFVTCCARLVDLDSDGDLDFLAFRITPAVFSPATGGQGLPPAQVRGLIGWSVYNNNSDGSFTDIAEKLGLRLEKTAIAAVVYDDFDNDRDLDLVILPASGSPGGGLAWVNDRVWQYRILDAEKTGLSVTGVFSATSGDPDKDGDRDLLVFTDKGLHLFANQGGFHFASDQSFADSCGRLGGTGGQFADMDNDGDLDIVIADAFRRDGSRGPALLINDWPRNRFINALQIDPGNLLAAIKTNGNASCVVADFSGKGRCDILLAAAGEEPVLIENVTPGGHWIEIDLLGTRGQDRKSRSNNSGIGARVEIKTGDIFQQYVVGVSSGPVAMPPYRIHAGLGRYTGVDWLRIMWPDAVLQAELELAADQVLTVTELQRKTSSCPHLFAWDGSHFEFVSDFGGMGGIGYLTAPGVYSKPDPTEYIAIANLAPRDGEYIFQVLEPIEEAVYLDEAKLIAVDHTAGTQVFPNEMMAVNAPPPPFELFCFKDIIEPVRAVDHRGVDVTKEISAIDRRYAGATDLDGRFVGFAKDHFVELDFGNRLGVVSPQSRLVLFLYGWVEYPYSATNFAASQAGLRVQAPSIHVLRDGVWVELFCEVGYPGGIQHMMTLDVTGKVLPGDQCIRIASNMELYWDRIFIATILDSLLAPATGRGTPADRRGPIVHEVPVKSADVHFLGYPREYSPDGRQPHLYDYDNIDRAVPWKIMQGSYTRYGPVEELLSEADDCYVIMGRGDELTLRFSADAFGPIPAGYRRTFILKTDSFCKDMDLYSAYPDTVEPLPFHAMSNYPYGPNEKYPDDPKRQKYRQEFNSRRVGRSDPPPQPALQDVGSGN